LNATGRHAPGPMKNREEGMKKLPNAKLNAPKPKLHRMTGRIAEERVHVASEARQESIEDLLSTEPTTLPACCRSRLCEQASVCQGGR